LSHASLSSRSSHVTVSSHFPRLSHLSQSSYLSHLSESSDSSRLSDSSHSSHLSWSSFLSHAPCSTQSSHASHSSNASHLSCSSHLPTTSTHEKTKAKYPLYYYYCTDKSSKNYNVSKRKIMLSHDVELNPGPEPNAKSLFTICSYNVNGIKDFRKLKRVSHFLNTLPFKNNCIINLQETHLTKNELSKLEYQWKWGSCHSAAIGASAGVSNLWFSHFFLLFISGKKFKKCKINVFYKLT